MSRQGGPKQIRITKIQMTQTDRFKVQGSAQPLARKAASLTTKEKS